MLAERLPSHHVLPFSMVQGKGVGARGPPVTRCATGLRFIPECALECDCRCRRLPPLPCLRPCVVRLPCRVRSRRVPGRECRVESEECRPYIIPGVYYTVIAVERVVPCTLYDMCITISQKHF